MNKTTEINDTYYHQERLLPAYRSRSFIFMLLIIINLLYFFNTAT